MGTDGVERSLLKSLQFGWHRYVTRGVTHEALNRFATLARPHKTDKELLRIGGDGDGGYLVPDDLEDIAAVFSPGVAETATFEQSFLERGVPCHLIDASVGAAPVSHQNMTFEPLFLGRATKDEFISLADWVARRAPDSGDLVLQMDIEGAEYEVLEAADPTLLSRFRILVIEFHRTHLIFTGPGLARFNAALERLSQHFLPVHVHPNNARPMVEFGGKAMPRAFEMTLIRRDRVTDAGPVSELPHPLDMTNVPGKPDPDWPEWLLS